jgi:uncharacterized protein YpiB (UPF0302 family)
MGLTRAQWKEKRLNELFKYVQENGHLVKDVIFWNTYPICVRNICVDGAAIFEDKVAFVDYETDTNTFRIRRYADEEERCYLEAVIADMKQLDKNKR